MPLSPGHRLGPYEIIAPIGAGGMGEVYRARDTRLERRVAIKVLPERLANDERALSRFEREAKILASLSHPNLLAIHDVGREGDVAYVVTELLEGETLRTRIATAEMPWPSAVEIGAAMADGMAAAHSRGIVHRDLKPENVFVTSDGRIKILDFGLARRAPVSSGDETATPTVSQHTEPGTILGTAGYMAPEQVRGELGDARSDVFAFGCVLYEMLAGRRAFQGKSGAETMAAILRDDVPSLQESGRSFPSDLVRLTARCLARDHERRFQSAQDLAFDLRALLAGTPLVSTPPETPVPPPRRRWTALIGAAALALAALVGIVLSTRPRAVASETRIQSIAVLPLANLSHDPDQDYFADGMTDELITQLAQIGALKVISRTSVMRYRDTKKPLADIAKELGVEGIVEGSVLRSGQRVRIAAQISDVSTGKIFWARSYERELKDVLVLQSEAARAIAGEIRIELSPQEQRRLATRRPVNPEAYEDYLRGRLFWYKFTPEDYQKSIEYFQKAIATDPNYAAAYAGLADTYVSMTWEGYFPPKEGHRLTEQAVRKALGLDPTLPDAHRPLASLAWGRDWDWTLGEKEWRQAVELFPGDSPTRRFHGSILRAMGRWDEAIAEMRVAMELDPLGVETNKTLGATYYWARQYDRAIDQYKKTLEIDPGHAPAHELLADVYARKKLYKESIAELERAATLAGNEEGATTIGREFAASGYAPAMQSLYRRNLASLTEASREGYVSPIYFAVIHSYLNESDQAFQWLEKAYEEHSPWLLLLRDPEFDNIRSDPRFVDLMRRVGVPP